MKLGLPSCSGLPDYARGEKAMLKSKMKRVFIEIIKVHINLKIAIKSESSISSPNLPETNVCIRLSFLVVFSRT